MAGFLVASEAQAAEPEIPPAAAVPNDRSAARPAARPRPRLPGKKTEPAAAPEITFTAAEMAKLEEIERIAHDRYPKRRDTPLRYLNITDNEVREIERLAANLSMTQLVNISPVVTGCACEEGAGCVEQVYIIGRYQNRQVGLQLSRNRNRWNIGRVQRWWLEYSALLAREDTMEKELYKQAHARKLLEFPLCPSGTTLNRTAGTGSTAVPAAASPSAAPAVRQ